MEHSKSSLIWPWLWCSIQLPSCHAFLAQCVITFIPACKHNGWGGHALVLSQCPRRVPLQLGQDTNTLIHQGLWGKVGRPNLWPGNLMPLAVCLVCLVTGCCWWVYNKAVCTMVQNRLIDRSPRVHLRHYTPDKIPEWGRNLVQEKHNWWIIICEARLLLRPPKPTYNKKELHHKSRDGLILGR